jgi:putative flippase GtrA
MERFIKFGLIGVINTAITIISYSFFVYIMDINYILANIIAYMLGMINSFIWNKNWVFRVKESDLSIYLRFLIVNLAMLGFNTLGLFILVNTFQLNKLISQIAVVGLGMVINFFLTKTWAFAQNRANSSR